VWQSPPDLLAAPQGRLDDVTGDLDEGRRPPAVLSAPPPSEPERIQPADPARAASFSAPAEVATAPDRPIPVAPATPTDVSPAAAPTSKPNGAALADDGVSPADEGAPVEPARAEASEVRPARSLAG
jgi:hypothetical protein